MRRASVQSSSASCPSARSSGPARPGPTVPVCRRGTRCSASTTIPDETLKRVRGAVADGAAPSVSAYLSTLADEGAREADLLRIVDALDAGMGAPSQEDIAWAKSVVEPAA